jgi:LmbE family N-acetylglucosaminyl deacetylase
VAIVGFLPWLRSARNGTSPSEPLPELGADGKKTLMAIMAHPDDIDFTSAGSIARWCAEGWTVYYVLATSGDKGTHDQYTRQELAALREQEQREAAAALGVKDVFFLGYPDGDVEPTHELRGQIVHLLRKYEVDVVLTWDGFRRGFNHKDHRNIGIAARDAVFPAVRDHLYYARDAADGLESRQVNELLLAGAEDPDYFVDISDYLEKKVDAVLCHRTQVSTQDRAEMLKNHRARATRPGRRGLYESFKRVRLGRPRPPVAVHEESASPGAAQSRT